MLSDRSFRRQQQTIDMLLGALEVEPFVAEVLLDQVSSELSSHIAKCASPDADLRRYARSLSSTLIELSGLDPQRSDFRARIHTLGSAFRATAHLASASGGRASD